MEGLTGGSNVVEVFAVGGANGQGSRPSQEDNYIINTSEDLPSEYKDTHALFAVFDGHGGEIVSAHAKTHIADLICSSPSFKSGAYEEAIQEAINKEDELLLKEFQQGENAYALAGSTASIALLDLKRGVLVVGNVGDSHIILAERDSGSGEVRGVDRLTTSHKPENPEEKQRIQQAGGQIHQQHAITRIGSLNMSRALGDLQYKTPLVSLTSVDQTDAQEVATKEHSSHTEDLITVKISSRRIELGRDKQYLLALTTDGITNAINDNTLMSNMMGLFNQGRNAEQVAGAMVNRATGTPQSDNSTCIAVWLNGVEAPIRLGEGGEGGAD
ncbi:phosphatase 2C-like domain-containing protein [Aspergillus venezuelensis]